MIISKSLFFRIRLLAFFRVNYFILHKKVQNKFNNFLHSIYVNSLNKPVLYSLIFFNILIGSVFINESNKAIKNLIINYRKGKVIRRDIEQIILYRFDIDFSKPKKINKVLRLSILLQGMGYLKIAAKLEEKVLNEIEEYNLNILDNYMILLNYKLYDNPSLVFNHISEIKALKKIVPIHEILSVIDFFNREKKNKYGDLLICGPFLDESIFYYEFRDIALTSPSTFMIEKVDSSLDKNNRIYLFYAIKNLFFKNLGNYSLKNDIDVVLDFEKNDNEFKENIEKNPKIKLTISNYNLNFLLFNGYPERAQRIFLDRIIKENYDYIQIVGFNFNLSINPYPDHYHVFSYGDKDMYLNWNYERLYFHSVISNFRIFKELYIKGLLKPKKELEELIELSIYDYADKFDKLIDSMHPEKICRI